MNRTHIWRLVRIVWLEIATDDHRHPRPRQQYDSFSLFSAVQRERERAELLCGGSLGLGRGRCVSLTTPLVDRYQMLSLWYASLSHTHTQHTVTVTHPGSDSQTHAEPNGHINIIKYIGDRSSFGLRIQIMKTLQRTRFVFDVFDFMMMCAIAVECSQWHRTA